MMLMLMMKIWCEDFEFGNFFVVCVVYCYGYDVYGEMLGYVGWVDIFFLLFCGEVFWLE